MTFAVSSRALLIAGAVAALFLGGCRSQSPRFYSLTPIQTDQAIPTGKSPAPNVVIGIGPVKVADYLDQSLIVTRTSDNQAQKAQFDWWVGSFKDNFANVLADDLGYLLATDQIYFYPWRATVPLDYQVAVDVIRCDGRLKDAAWLEARWRIFGGPEKKLLKMHRSLITEPVRGDDYAALVAAESRAVAQLSQEIAAAIRGARSK